MKKRFFIFLIFLAYSKLGFGQSVLKGRVKNSNGKAKGVNVRLIDEDQNVLICKTDFDGNYHFNLKKPGSYQLEVSAPGHKSMVIQRDIGGGEDKQVFWQEIDLIPEDKMVLRIPDFYFFPEEANLTTNGKLELNKLGGVLKALNHVAIEVYADPDKNRNQKILARKKAETVKKYFMAIGVQKERIKVKDKSS
ncbi:carboxypeptidase regulatory-like domain-containing protein [Xanthovirga aplysinae]|uniref:carboxypeptidase regulatory-like domain-containing protein n=1 Tax=Xanthovirga aplysinae TaxID=2529853 RepID=UPI0012BB8903|nr:carboxypeptidase regulatory-like domain-containing protein [Xanthovirga aplysinae]MTI29934.1 hypothetical protein [Xanthovirga aplysinae]